MRKEGPSWGRIFFEDDAARRPHAQVKAQVDGIDRCLRLETRSRVLDLGCRSGRRALELARRGHRVLVVDPDEQAFAHARAAAKDERLNAHFLKADLRAISYRAEFDAIVCLDGAVGRLPTDRDDLRVLDAARKALKPGAKLLVDVVNREWLIRRFEPGPWERGDGAGESGVDRITFDLEKGRLESRRAAASFGVRLYTMTELLVQAERAGLSYRGAWGGFDGSPYGMDSPRLVALFERPRDERATARADDGLMKAIRIKGRR